MKYRFKMIRMLIIFIFIKLTAIFISNHMLLFNFYNKKYLWVFVCIGFVYGFLFRECQDSSVQMCLDCREPHRRWLPR